MAASGGCKLLDKTSAKRLIDSLDTILADCDGITFVVVRTVLLSVSIAKNDSQSGQPLLAVT